MTECNPFAAFKRCQEYFGADPVFRTAFLEDGPRAIADLGFDDLPDADAAAEAIRQISLEGIGNINDRTRITNPYFKDYLTMTDTVNATVRTITN